MVVKPECARRLRRSSGDRCRRSHSLALKSDGTLFVGKILPVKHANGLRRSSGGRCRYYHSLALKSDGTVVTWGYNQDGQMNVPGNANLRDLKLQEGDFTESFDPSVMDYTYYYDGQSLSSVDVTPTMASTDQTVMYVNNELLPDGNTKTIDICGSNHGYGHSCSREALFASRSNVYHYC